jgi:hypothetical protein
MAASWIVQGYFVANCWFIFWIVGSQGDFNLFIFLVIHDEAANIIHALSVA